jgi:hypothetical protein
VRCQRQSVTSGVSELAGESARRRLGPGGARRRPTGAGSSGTARPRGWSPSPSTGGTAM